MTNQRTPVTSSGDSVQNRPAALNSFRSQIPARMDRLPWTRFHWMVVFALGITWILDGLEVTLGGAISGVLEDPASMGFSPAQIGLLGSAYVSGAVVGALIFGRLTDSLGRKKLFFITLAVYLTGCLLSAFAWDIWSFLFFRFITGAGIGGEYSAINSAVDELIPARVRGRVDLIINGSYWLGAALGSLSTLVILNPKYFEVDHGWRVGFAVGGLIGIGILALRKHVPESPRWLMIHGDPRQAEEIVSGVEKIAVAETGKPLPAPSYSIEVHPRGPVSFTEIARTVFTRYRRQSFLGLALMTSQAFLYNAIFFTYALVLTNFYNVPAMDTGLYLLPFAIGNFLGPLLLGHFFDTVGRRIMISGTYAMSAVLLAITGYLFAEGYLTATTQTALWSVIFFFASAAASSAYLTVSEIFPLETRGLAIAFFFALGTGAGGIVAPYLFGELIGSGSRYAIFYGYAAAAVLMIGAAIVEWIYGIDAEGKALEEIALPLSCRVDS
ncbi:MAG: MFS transporter [Bdellovibrionales bacterium]|nr:MFS transporter [Bdellovibrionales bacterium]